MVSPGAVRGPRPLTPSPGRTPPLQRSADREAGGLTVIGLRSRLAGGAPGRTRGTVTLTNHRAVEGPPAAAWRERAVPGGSDRGACLRGCAESIFWRRVLSAHLGVTFLGAGQLGPDSSQWTGPRANLHGTPGPRPPSVARRWRLYLTPVCPVGRDEREPHPLQGEMGPAPPVGGGASVTPAPAQHPAQHPTLQS